jgi:hypothetical protein
MLASVPRAVALGRDAHAAGMRAQLRPALDVVSVAVA